MQVLAHPSDSWISNYTVVVLNNENEALNKTLELIPCQCKSGKVEK
jgi:hypothetical protein